MWRPLTNQPWHLYPAVVIALVLMWLALGALLKTARTRRWMTLLAYLVAATLLFLAGLRTVSFALYGQHTSFWFGGRHRVYEQIGRQMALEAGPNDACAAGEVGTLAYYSGIPVHDWNGLVTADNNRLAQSLADGNPGPIRWIVAWARGDLVAFRATVENKPLRVFPFERDGKNVYWVKLR